MLDLRRLFDKYRIQWKDRGKNCARGNVNICCPLCNRGGNPDYGFHLGIYEASGQWNCFRNPKHNGHNPVYLFTLLGIPKHEYEHLKWRESARTQEKHTDKVFSLMMHFLPAESSQEALSYLMSRMFDRPDEACKLFHLKVDPVGHWAGRLIIPLTIGWTGRAMREHINLRYEAYTTEDGFFLHRGKEDNRSIMLLEGAMDAMRVASVTKQIDVVAKCGNKLSPALLSFLRDKKYLTIYNVPDGDVPFTAAFEETRKLRSYLPASDVKQLKIPVPYKDCGAMTESVARGWVTSNAN